MQTINIGESVIAEFKGYAERIKTGLTYDEAKAICQENHWKMKLHGRECKLKIVRDNEPIKEMPEYLKLN